MSLNKSNIIEKVLINDLPLSGDAINRVTIRQ